VRDFYRQIRRAFMQTQTTLNFMQVDRLSELGLMADVMCVYCPLRVHVSCWLCSEPIESHSQGEGDMTIDTTARIVTDPTKWVNKKKVKALRLDQHFPHRLKTALPAPTFQQMCCPRTSQVSVPSRKSRLRPCIIPLWHLK
jgi:hypothetical protein